MNQYLYLVGVEPGQVLKKRISLRILDFTPEKALNQVLNDMGNHANQDGVKRINRIKAEISPVKRDSRGHPMVWEGAVYINGYRHDVRMLKILTAEES